MAARPCHVDATGVDSLEPYESDARFRDAWAPLRPLILHPGLILNFTRWVQFHYPPPNDPSPSQHRRFSTFQPNLADARAKTYNELALWEKLQSRYNAIRTYWNGGFRSYGEVKISRISTDRWSDSLIVGIPKTRRFTMKHNIRLCFVISWFGNRYRFRLQIKLCRTLRHFLY